MGNQFAKLCDLWVVAKGSNVNTTCSSSSSCSTSAAECIASYGDMLLLLLLLLLGKLEKALVPNSEEEL